MKLRVAHVIVQPVLVWDDGKELTPGPQAQSVQLPLSALAGLAERIKQEIAEQEAQLTALRPSPTGKEVIDHNFH